MVIIYYDFWGMATQMFVCCCQRSLSRGHTQLPVFFSLVESCTGASKSFAPLVLSSSPKHASVSPPPPASKLYRVSQNLFTPSSSSFSTRNPPTASKTSSAERKSSGDSKIPENSIQKKVLEVLNRNSLVVWYLLVLLTTYVLGYLLP